MTRRHPAVVRQPDVSYVSVFSNTGGLLFPDDAGISHDDAVGGNVLHHHGTRADGHVVPDGNAPGDHRVGEDRHVVANDGIAPASRFVRW